MEGKVEPGWGKIGKCRLSEFFYPYPNSYLPEGEERKERDREGEEFNTRALRHKGKIKKE